MKSPSGGVGLLILSIMILIAVLAPFISPYDPLQMDKANRLQGPSLIHLFGTDEYGRDQLSRILYGARSSLSTGILSVTIAALFGINIGLLAGYYRKVVDAISMRLMDAIISFPAMLLAIVVIAIVGTGSLSATLGVDGFFFATQAANYQTLEHLSHYQEFGLTYDYPIAKKIKNAGKLCLLHVCMRKVMLEAFRDFPADIINWDNLHSGTDLNTAREMLPDKALAGGINIFKIMDYSPNQVDEMIETALKEAGNTRFMLAPTCVLLSSTPRENLLEIRRYVNNR